MTASARVGARFKSNMGFPDTSVPVPLKSPRSCSVCAASCASDFAAKTGKMCCQAEWPVYDASKTVASSVEMAIQVNGKMKGTVTMPVDSDEETVKAAALSVDKVQKATEGMQIVKTILVKNRLINLIVKPR